VIPSIRLNRGKLRCAGAERFYRIGGWTEVGRKKDGQIIFQKSLST
jgi:hypothetical protein